MIPLARTIVVFLAVLAALIFSGVTLTEINYVSAHPHAYGPAKVIAWCGGAGALLSVAVALLAMVWGHDGEPDVTN